MEISKQNINTKKKVNIFLVILIVIIFLALITIGIIIYLELKNNSTKNNTSYPKIILTHYAIETYSQMASSEDAFRTYLSDMIVNFCKHRGISVFSMFLNPSFTKDSREIFRWYGDNKWIYNNFIKVCYDNGIEPAFNVYPSFKDSMWVKDTNGSTWSDIGKRINDINEYSNGQKSGNIVKFLIYDNEECNCISPTWNGDPLVFVRTELKKGYPNLPDDFTILSSGDVGQSFQNKNGYDMGLGEVYWNIGQAEPCVGNASQYNNYAPVCKEGSSHRRYVNQPKEYLEFLINSSKQSGTSLPVENYKRGNTVPLFSTESLYAEDGTIGRCTQLSYWGKQSQTKISNPETSDKICGTFDGFSYWDWDKFREFLSLYAQKFSCKYVGIYDAMFIPSNWMKDGKFNNDEYNPELDKNWPNISKQPEKYNNPQDYVNYWIMQPDTNTNTFFKYLDTKTICLADTKTKECKNGTRLNLCPNFMTYDTTSNMCKKK